MKALKLLASSLIGFSLCSVSVAALPMEEQSRMVPNLRPKDADYLNYLKAELDFPGFTRHPLILAVGLFYICVVMSHLLS